MRVIRRIIVHCSDTATGTLEGITRYHIQVKGWSAVGYHAVIERDGAIKAGRPEETIGAHCYGHNADTLGVCMVGIKIFTDMQWASLITLLRRWAMKYNLNLKIDVFCHYQLDTNGKTCPNFTIDTLKKRLGMMENGERI